MNLNANSATSTAIQSIIMLSTCLGIELHQPFGFTHLMNTVKPRPCIFWYVSSSDKSSSPIPEQGIPAGHWAPFALDTAVLHSPAKSCKTLLPLSDLFLGWQLAPGSPACHQETIPYSSFLCTVCVCATIFVVEVLQITSHLFFSETTNTGPIPYVQHFSWSCGVYLLHVRNQHGIALSRRAVVLSVQQKAGLVERKAWKLWSLEGHVPKFELVAHDSYSNSYSLVSCLTLITLSALQWWKETHLRRLTKNALPHPGSFHQTWKWQLHSGIKKKLHSFLTWFQN